MPLFDKSKPVEFKENIQTMKAPEPKKTDFLPGMGVLWFSDLLSLPVGWELVAAETSGEIQTELTKVAPNAMKYAIIKKV